MTKWDLNRRSYRLRIVEEEEGERMKRGSEVVGACQRRSGQQKRRERERERERVERSLDDWRVPCFYRFFLPSFLFWLLNPFSRPPGYCLFNHWLDDNTILHTVKPHVPPLLSIMVVSHWTFDPPSEPTNFNDLFSLHFQLTIFF